jgi:uridine kinase
MNEITITFNDDTKQKFNFDTPIYEVSKAYQEKTGIDVIGARINNEIVPMNTKLKKDVKIDFIDIFDPYGYRMYQGALKFIFEVAVKTTLDNAEVRFLHSVPKGIMSEIIGVNITRETLSKIKENMAKIISDDEPIIKYNVQKKEAINYFKKFNQIEKTMNIHNTNMPIVSMYRLKNIYNYYYTEMPYSTGKINKFDLVYLGNNKIILVYPSSRTDGITPEYVHYDNIIKTFETGEDWLKIMKVPYLPYLNNLVSNGNIKKLIEANELVFNDHISSIAKEISNKKDIKVVLISGPSSSGKTTTNKRLSSYLQALGYHTIPISVDDYYKDIEDMKKDDVKNYEVLESIDTKLFNQHINDLINGKTVHLPIYNFEAKHKTFSSTGVKLEENSILLIEGLHCLNDELTSEIENKYKYKIYLSPFIPLEIDRHNYVSTVDLRLLRRIVRDYRTRATDVSETIEMWQTVRTGEEKYIFPFIHQADVVVNTAYVFEVGVLKVFAEPLLYSVGQDSPYYEEARRLINSMQGFYPISSEYISKDSILREFIGGN